MSNRILLSVLALCFVYVLASCGEHSHEEKGNDQTQGTEASHEHEHDHDDESHDHDHDHEGDHDHDHDAVDQSGAEFTSAYVCPMHCEGSGSDEPGQCPVCEMDYKENPEAKGSEDENATEPV